jgi:Na+/phosphate symporter
MGYAIACIVYLVATHCLGTPFKDSLSDEQRRVMNQSKRRRGAAFGVGVGVAIVVLLLWRPFSR